MGRIRRETDKKGDGGGGVVEAVSPSLSVLIVTVTKRESLTPPFGDYAAVAPSLKLLPAHPEIYSETLATTTHATVLFAPYVPARALSHARAGGGILNLRVETDAARPHWGDQRFVSHW